MADRVMDEKTLRELFNPLIKDALAELYAPGQAAASLNQKDVERVMRDLAFRTYDQVMQNEPNDDESLEI